MPAADHAVELKVAFCVRGVAPHSRGNFNQRLTRKRGYQRAVIATPHKLLRCIFAPLRDGTPYRDPATDYEALLVQRNASRWLRKLQEFDILVHNDAGTLSLRWPSRQDRTVPVH